MLAWPITLSQVLFLAPGVYDAIWLGQLGTAAQAAAGLTMTVRITMISVLMALSLASGAVVARYVGAGDQDQASRAAGQGLVMMVLASGSLGVVGMLLARPLLVLVGAEGESLALGLRYARVIFAGLIPMELLPSLGGMLDAAGAAKTRLTMTVAAVVTLIVSEPLLVRAIGIEGAALASVTYSLVGTLVGLGALSMGRAAVRIRLRDLLVDLPMMARIWRIALPAVLQRGLPNLAMTVLVRLVAAYGETALAAWIVVTRLCNFAMVPAMGLARSTPALVGQNLGAGNPGRAARAVNKVFRLVLLISVCAFGILAVAAPTVMSLFSGDEATVQAGVHIIRMVAWGYVALSVYYVFDGTLSGAGDTVSPMVVNLLALWGVQIPLAFALSRFTVLDVDGIWLALVLGWVLQAALVGWRVFQGGWRHHHI